jgi:hypothetical protein
MLILLRAFVGPYKKWGVLEFGTVYAVYPDCPAGISSVCQLIFRIIYTADHT